MHKLLCIALVLLFNSCGRGLCVGSSCTESSVATFRIDTVSPALGGRKLTITITGSGFTQDMTVKVGGVACLTTTFISSTEIACRTPDNLGGTASVEITGPQGEKVTSANAYTYSFYGFSPNSNANTISAYQINSTTGAITAVGTPVAAGTAPRGAATAGKYVYASSSTGVYGYSLDIATGALTALPGSPFTAGSSPREMDTDKTGRFLYVCNGTGASVSAFSIGGDGSLTSLAGSPYAVAAAPKGAVVSPNNRFLYITNGTGNSISAFNIESDGTLTTVAGSPFATGSSPRAAAIDPLGRFLYNVNVNSDTITGYSINSTTGALTPVPGSPYASGVDPYATVVELTGKFLYAPHNTGPGELRVYQIDQSTGALTAISGSPFTVPTALFGIGLDITGKFLVLPYGDTYSSMGSYSLDLTTGTPTQVSGSPIATQGGSYTWVMN